MASRSLRPTPPADGNIGEGAPSVALAPDVTGLGAPGLRAFFRIAEAWGLNQHQQGVLLGAPSRQTLHNWRQGKGTNKLNRDLLDRLSYLLGIYRALQIIYPNPVVADGWMTRPHAHFENQPPLSIAMRGSIMDLAQLRRYLDSLRT